MKHIFTFFLFATVSFSVFGQSNLSATYDVNGYIFHPSASRALSLVKSIKKIDSITFQADFADLAGNSFQFQINANNQLVNWVSTAFPSSGFMTADNPGNQVFKVTPLPGQAPYTQSTYNNTYDPMTHTLHLHYGYAPIANLGQTGYTRQIYEEYKYQEPIISFSPTTGTTGTPITIHGKGFSSLNGNYQSGIVYFGSSKDFNTHEDSLSVLSDTLMIAWVGRATSGNVNVNLPNGNSGSLNGFTYQPLPAITNSGWRYIGNPGFSSNKAIQYVNTACGIDNVPYVAYIDSATQFATVMKFTNGSWQTVGRSPSIGKAYNIQLALDNKSRPIVAFKDSANGGSLSVKKFNGTVWGNVGSQNFDSLVFISMAVDNAGILYLETHKLGGSAVTVLKQNGITWDTVGNEGFATPFYGQTNLTIDKNNNTPYIVLDQSDSLYNPQATVMKFDGTNWVTVGSPLFTSAVSLNGAYYLDIAVDDTGTPMVSAQTDNSFERSSVFSYTNGEWKALGYPNFSKSHVHYLSFATNKTGIPYLLYSEDTYNGLGSVVSYTNSDGWRPVGSRGFLTGGYFSRNALATDTNNSPIVAFYDFTQGGKVSVMKYGSDPLPVTFLNLGAVANENTIILDWNTTNEKNVSNYIIEHSIDGSKFKAIGSLNANRSSYQFTDNNPNDGINYYRLICVDKKGVTTYSKVVSVQSNRTRLQFAVFPNPSRNFITVSGNHIASLQIIDNLGKVLRVVPLKDATSPTISVNGLQAGVYQLRIQTIEGTVSGVGFVKE